MASVDKESLRESIASLEENFVSLNRAGKMPDESKILVQSLLTLIKLMAALFLERTTKKTSRNSSKPPSQTDKDDTSLTKKGKKSKGQQEQNIQSSSFRSVEHVTVIPVTFCNECGEDLSKVACHHLERRSTIDIIFEKVTEHVDVEVKECPFCDAEVVGAFPDTMPHQLQYGDGIRAYVVNLIVAQMVALARVRTMVTTLIGVKISESTLLGFVMRVHKGLEEWERQTRAALLKAPSLHCDETSCRVAKKNYWIHVYSDSGGRRLKMLHPKRGKKAIDDIDMIPKYSGTIIHDCWSSYLSYVNCLHALCGSHLLRELTFMVEANGYRWAQRMKALLKSGARSVTESEEKRVDEEEYLKYRKHYRTILTQGLQELPEIPPKPRSKRGRMAKSDAHNLHERLVKYEDAVLRFLHDPTVSFTNNTAERALRMGKVKQKVSGCFRSEEFAHAYCRVSSYLDTMKAHGYNPIIALQFVLKGEIPKI